MLQESYSEGVGEEQIQQTKEYKYEVNCGSDVMIKHFWVTLTFLYSFFDSDYLIVTVRDITSL
jgi:hypothetical protein